MVELPQRQRKLASDLASYFLKKLELGEMVLANLSKLEEIVFGTDMSCTSDQIIYSSDFNALIDEAVKHAGAILLFRTRNSSEPTVIISGNEFSRL